MGKGKKQILSPEEKRALQIHVYRKFRALINLVIFNKPWIEEEGDDNELGDNVAKNIQLMLVKKKVQEKSLLARKHKSIMLKRPELRTSDEIDEVARVLPSNKFFKKYNQETLDNLARTCKFQYFPSGRIIYAQGNYNSQIIDALDILKEPFSFCYFDHIVAYMQIHLGHSLHRMQFSDAPAISMYVILNGEVNGIYQYYDVLSHSKNIASYGHMLAGYPIGIVNLMSQKPRSLTVQTAIPTELICIDKPYFDQILKRLFRETYQKMAAHYNSFEYLRMWNADTKRICSILSKWRTFKADQIILSPTSSLNQYACFLISGVCYLLECLVLKVEKDSRGRKYTLFQKDKRRKSSTTISDLVEKSRINIKLTDEEIRENIIREANELIEKASAVSPEEEAQEKNESMGEWIPSNTTETHFIKICEFRTHSCFNIGENMYDRQVVARTNVHLLLIPKVWLIHQNLNNIWSILIAYLNRTIPNTEKVFKDFLQARVWTKYKRNMVEEIVRNHVITNNNTRHNIPYSTRLKSPEYFNAN